MKKKCLAALMMVTVLALTACGAKETTEDSHQTEEQVTDTADETTAEASPGSSPPSSSDISNSSPVSPFLSGSLLSARIIRTPVIHSRINVFTFSLLRYMFHLPLTPAYNTESSAPIRVRHVA